jgi:hypothetical protein
VDSRKENIATNHVYLFEGHTVVLANGILDKETTSYNDIFDAYRLALRYYKINHREEQKEQEQPK